MTAAQASTLLHSAYKAEVLHRGREFVADEATSSNVSRLADFLVNPAGKFGFMLIGNPGNGKTTLLYAFQNVLNFLSRYDYIDKDFGLRIVDAKDVAPVCKDHKAWFPLRSCNMLAIEDLGRESTEVLDYGNTYSPIIDLFEFRYDRQLFTAFTSNLSVDELSSKYGRRIADRFREMFARIVFPNPTYR